MRIFCRGVARGAAIAAVAAMSVADTTGDGAGARQPDRPLILLSCPQDPDRDHGEALCRALIQALSETASSHVIRRVPRGAERPARAGDTGIALYLDTAAKAGSKGGALSGHLEWRSGDGSASSGPEVRLDMMDSGLTAAGYATLARGLVKASPDMVAALATAGP